MITPEYHKPLLQVRSVSRRFPGVLAVDNVDMEVHRRQILAVIGENGAGKSTLMRIIAGVLTPDAGQLLLNAKPVTIDSVATATKLGIALIHQELNLSENLDIAANVFLGREPYYAPPLKLINQRRLYQDTEKILARLQMDCSPKKIVRHLSIGQRQLVEIARALSVNAHVLILDEPTSSLSQTETERLFEVLRQLKAAGIAILYVSHRLGEVGKIADRVMALRDGRNCGELTREEINHNRMVKLMVGRDIKQFYHHEPHTASRPMLQVENLTLRHNPHTKINLTVGAGEIVCLAGLVGAGRTELARALFGIDTPLSGTIKIDSRAVNITRPQDALDVGMALVPEDRKLHGLLLEMTVQDNITIADLKHYQCAKLIRRQKLRKAAENMIKQLDIRTPGLRQPVRYLSGGNQQKVVLAKWLSQKLRVLLLDEPTRGVDVVAKEEIYRLIEQLALEGMAILMISSEMQEVLSISDRVVVMNQGRITGELSAEMLTEESIMYLATGTVK